MNFNYSAGIFGVALFMFAFFGLLYIIITVTFFSNWGSWSEVISAKQYIVITIIYVVITSVAIFIAAGC